MSDDDFWQLVGKAFESTRVCNRHQNGTNANKRCPVVLVGDADMAERSDRKCGACHQQFVLCTCGDGMELRLYGGGNSGETIRICINTSVHHCPRLNPE